MFFTIKQFFFKIKLWLAQPADTKERKSSPMKNLDVLAAGLVIVGALNWGLAGLFHLDLVATLIRNAVR